MAQFTLVWDNTDVLASSNSTGQTVSYRYKTIGGAFDTTGFTPSNILNTDAITAISPNLDNNKVVQFKVACDCTSNGPTNNDNGLQEAIAFACIAPNITPTGTGATIIINVVDTDITKARFTVKNSGDNTIVMAASVVDRDHDYITKIVSGLEEGTSYYVQIELYAIVDNTEVISSSSNYLGEICSPYPFSTDATPACDSVTSVDVSSVETS